MLIKTNIFIIRVSEYIGLLFIFGSVIIFAFLLIKRLLLIKKEKRNNYLIQEWRRTLLNNLYYPSDPITNLSKKNIFIFLILWNNMQDTLIGPEKEQLNLLAKTLNINKIALKMLSSKRLSKRLLAISVLGHLKDEKAWNKIHKFTESNNMTLAINAIQALAKINPDRSVNIVILFMINKEYWPKYRMSAILNEIGASRYSKPLAREIILQNPEKQSLLLSMLHSADGQIVLPLVKQLILTADNNEVISSCLDLLSIFGNSRHIQIIKNYLDHQESFVRMKAVKSLALIVTEDDLPSLEKCLNDRNWWVRYRAAEAITLLPSMNYEKIMKIRERQTDRFAIDILNFVIQSKKG